MPFDKTTMSNMALATIGVNARIGNIDTEKSNEAIQCRLWFDHVTRLLLEAKFWPGFAGKRVVLQDLGTPPTGWAYRYKYPTDCAYAYRIVNPAAPVTPGRGQKIPFRVLRLDDAYGKSILCNATEAELEYNIEILDPALFSATFAQAHIMGLGAHISMPLRVSPDIVKSSQSQFSAWLSEAATHTEREMQEDQEPNSDLVTVRG